MTSFLDGGGASSGGVAAGVQTVNGRNGAVTLAPADVPGVVTKVQSLTPDGSGNVSLPYATSNTAGLVKMVQDFATVDYDGSIPFVPGLHRKVKDVTPVTSNDVTVTGSSGGTFGLNRIPTPRVTDAAITRYKIIQPSIFTMPNGYDDDPLMGVQDQTALTPTPPTRMSLMFVQDATGHEVLLAPTPTGADGADVSISKAAYSTTFMELVWVDNIRGWLVTSNVKYANPRLRHLSELLSTPAYDPWCLDQGLGSAAFNDLYTEVGWLSARCATAMKNATSAVVFCAPSGTTYTAGTGSNSGILHGGATTADWVPGFSGQVIGAGGVTSLSTSAPRSWCGPSQWRQAWGGTTFPVSYSGGNTGLTFLHEIQHCLAGVLYGGAVVDNLGNPALNLQGTQAVYIHDVADIVNFYTANVQNNAACGAYARTNVREFYAEVAAATHYYQATTSLNALNYVLGNSSTLVSQWNTLAAKYRIY